MAVKESGDGGIPYGTAAEGSFGAALVNGDLPHQLLPYSRVKGKGNVSFRRVRLWRIQVVPRFCVLFFQGVFLFENYRKDYIK